MAIIDWNRLQIFLALLAQVLRISGLAHGTIALLVLLVATLGFLLELPAWAAMALSSDPGTRQGLK